jgi:adenosine/AMP kinase
MMTMEEAGEVQKVVDCFRNPANAVQVAVVDTKDQRVVLSLDDMLAKDAKLLLRYLCEQYTKRLT